MNKEIIPHRRGVKTVPSNRGEQPRPTIGPPIGAMGLVKRCERRTREALSCPAVQFENVSQSLMSPLLRPAVSHFWRCAEEPWVKLSGTA